MSRWIVVLVAFLSASTAFLPSSLAQSKRNLSIKLKAKALVMGPRILLGEVGVIEGADRKTKAMLDSVVLGQAPPPGESRELTLSYIKHKLRAAGMKKYIRFIKGPKSIRVTTAHVEIDKAILRDAVTDFVRKHLPPSVVRHEVEFRRLPQSVRVGRPPTSIRVQVLGDTNLRGFKSFSVELVAEAERLARIPVAAYIRTFESVLKARARIRKGEMLDQAMLRQEVIETTRLPSEPLQPQTLSGKRARVIISAGQVLTESQFEVPPMVERGEIVKMIARLGTVEVATMGKAQQTGGKSARIRVRNLGTGKLLLAKVIDRHTVLVEP